MSWQKRYMVPFESRLGEQYRVYIYENSDTTPDVVTLTGSEEPFVTQEDSNEDIFTPIRKQTGYLRILDNSGGTLLEEIMPQNNTEKMVTLVKMDISGRIFTDGDIMWKGFLCAEAFTQPWDNDITELEFPVKSVLAALEDVQIESAVSGMIKRLAYTVARGIVALCGEMPFDNVTHVGSMVLSEWMTKEINHSLFFKDSVYQSGGDTIYTKEGNSYYNSISEVLSTLGLTARQEGNNLILARYDRNGYDVFVNTMTWAQFYAIAYEGSNDMIEGVGITSTDMLKVLIFRSTKNEAGYVPGGRMAKVVLSIKQFADTFLQLPETTEDDSQVTPIYTEPSYRAAETISEGNPIDVIHVQQHGVRTGSNETFTYNLYIRYAVDSPTTTWRYERERAATYEECVACSQIQKPAFNDIGKLPWNVRGYNLENYVIATGAFPVRWFKQEHGTNGAVTLVNGLMMVQKVLRGSDTSISDNEECYSIVANNNISANVGSFFNINFSCHSFFGYYVKNNVTARLSGWGHYSIFDKWVSVERSADNTDNKIVEEDVEYTMYCALRVGNQWWTGSGWSTTGQAFPVTFKNEEIVTNKSTVGANVDVEGGYFIPIPSGGITNLDVEFKIMDGCRTEFTYEYKETEGDTETVKRLYTIYPYCKIISDLAVGICYPKSVTESERSTNTYRKVIMQSGFREDKEINLIIGTDNNNVDGTPSFIKNSSGNNITTLPYYFGGVAQNERPEEHLLNRMAAYYNQVRRTFRAKVETGIDLFRTRYTYLGRVFFGVDKKHDWREDEQEVKFIEVD